MKKKPIFRIIVIPVMAWTFFLIFLFISSILGQDVVETLKENGRQVVQENVYSRRFYVENQFLMHWTNIDSTVESLNAITESYFKNKNAQISTLDTNATLASHILEEMTPEMIRVARNNKVTGAFVILNTEDLEQSMTAGDYHNKFGVYLRRNDYGAHTPEGNGDIIMLRSPITVTQNLQLRMDAMWDVNFDFRRSEIPYYDFFYTPFQSAYRAEEKLYWKDYGYLSGPEQLFPGAEEAITYSVPLMLSDGTVYGVFGIDITKSHFQQSLRRAQKEGNSTYFLGKKAPEGDGFLAVFGQENLNWVKSRDGKLLLPDTAEYYIFEEEMNIYPTNGPYEEDRWVVAAVIPDHVLYDSVYDVEMAVSISTVVSLLLGLAGSVFISYKIQEPIAKLSRDMKGKSLNEEVRFAETGILEVDNLTDKVTHLSRELLDNSKKFSTILRMASNGIGGVMINEREGSIYVTEQCFSLFGIENAPSGNISMQEYEDLMEQVSKYRLFSDFDSEGNTYQIPTEDGYRFVHFHILKSGDMQYGLVEDVTKATLETRIITHERDHDGLTNLMNRRAFRRETRRLFERFQAEIRIGIFIMLDLDNLKYINDTYGHNYGDRYIQEAAKTLQSSIKNDGICSRIAGDEFNAFLFGFASRDEAMKKVEDIQTAFRQASIALPDGRTQSLLISGGVAWYPEQAKTLPELERFADFAMYTVKNTTKGDIRFFDRDIYESERQRAERASALTSLLAHREVYFAMQPIVAVETGKIYGYEALLRPLNAKLNNVVSVLETAKHENKLNQIEELTWTVAIERVAELKKEGMIEKSAVIFINSIPNQKLSRSVLEEHKNKYADLFPDIVLELTEEEAISKEGWQHKRKMQEILHWRIAIDDYGAGYNGDNMLLTVNPDFIKVDLEIIRGIHLNPDKQSILRKVVLYAHERGKKIIAEGVETKDELQCVIQLGADYVQGYFLGRPEHEPIRAIPEDKVLLMQQCFSAQDVKKA